MKFNQETIIGNKPRKIKDSCIYCHLGLSEKKRENHTAPLRISSFNDLCKHHQKLLLDQFPQKDRNLVVKIIDQFGKSINPLAKIFLTCIPSLIKDEKAREHNRELEAEKQREYRKQAAKRREIVQKEEAARQKAREEEEKKRKEEITRQKEYKKAKKKQKEARAREKRERAKSKRGNKLLSKAAKNLKNKDLLPSEIMESLVKKPKTKKK